MITIIGTRATISDVEFFIQRLMDFSKKMDICIQVFDAKFIYGKDHLISATTHAKRAFQQQTNATNTLAMEILLYAAGERQIQKAIKKMGIKKGRQELVFVLTNTSDANPQKKISEAVIRRLLQTFKLTFDETVISGTKDTLKRFGITDKELSTVPEEKYGDIILEKVALVDVIK
jgi:KEOPS complex subunit Cgi121